MTLPKLSMPARAAGIERHAPPFDVVGAIEMKILVVEDTPEILRPVTVGLQREGHDVHQATDGRAALRMALEGAFDLIVLDIMLPGLDGLSVLRALREGGSVSRVMLLTAKDAIADRVAGLQQGADDYLVKPFALEELLARVETLQRRSLTLSPGDELCAGSIVVNTAAKTVRRAADGESIRLAPREYAILEYLLRNRGRLVTRTEIERRIYDDYVEPMSNVVDSAICRLRREIDASDGESLIVTRRGQGYIIPADDE